MRQLFVSLLLIVTILAYGQKNDTIMKNRITKSDNQWKQDLGDLSYKVLRECGTEPPFTGKYVNTKDDGYYYCAGCGAKLFSSEAKYDSGSGWPSFFSSYDKSHIIQVQDRSLGMIRTEIRCANCGGHLGHIFNDGPQPTGLRYCVNSASLQFVAE